MAPLATGGSAPIAISRDVDALLLRLSPSGQVVRLLEEVDALAVVDACVQESAELVTETLQPVLDQDQDEVLLTLFWLYTRDALSSPASYASVRALLRSGPVLVAATRWQLAGPMRPAVLEAAAAELARRRSVDPATEDQMSVAAREMAEAYPEQKGPVGLAILIIVVAVEAALAADHINPSHMPE